MSTDNLIQQEIFDFIRKIFILEAEFPISISSWKRTVKRNQSVGGKPKSKHLIWLAVDVILDDVDNVILKNEFFRKVKELGLKYLEEEDHIHVQV